MSIVQITPSHTFKSSAVDLDQMAELPPAVADADANADADADADAARFFRLPVCWSMIMTIIISAWFGTLTARNKVTDDHVK